MFGALNGVRRSWIAATGAGLAGLLVLAGCSQTASSGSIQVQFYSPHGASVVVRGVDGDTAVPVISRGPLSDRLERRPDELAVFDLNPGRYAFAYTSSPGAEDAVIYGELDLRAPASPITKRFCNHAFLPIKLPSLQPQEGEHRFPVRDLSYTVGLEGEEFEHVKQGDLVTKVYFVADLERVRTDYEVAYRERLAEVDRELSVLADRETYLENRYQGARREALQRDPEMNIEDKVAYEKFDWFGIEEPYVRLARKKQEVLSEREAMLIERERLLEERGRRNALLRSLKIVHRDGALVLATPDLQLPYTNTVQQVAELGEVVAVLNVGGRHHRWAGDLLAALEPAPAELSVEPEYGPLPEAEAKIETEPGS